ncbi:MAG: phosphoribosylaminoimidazolecarboxamide formyltransferase [Chloroflexi bacterium]|nr:phosphoribosylaminoimidazolecarboxamide formyltransferase [Chloroflexota bacterium]
MAENERSLRYGCNPHQTPARVYTRKGALPFNVLNGGMSYINVLDALNSWQLVKELKQATGLPAAASFKHVSPSGAAVGRPLAGVLRRAYRVDDMDLSPLATAYARARGTDRLCSFGDWVALSDMVDVPTAQLLRREVSDGVIAPGYEPQALALLRKKKEGKYIILEMDAGYEPPALEARDVFGVTVEQRRNDAQINAALLQNIVTDRQALSDAAMLDLLVALITLKYTQSNSVCLAVDGQVIGVGAGQQSRIHCTRLAASKADNWYLRQHPAVLDLKFKPGVQRPDKDNAVDLYLRDDLTPVEESAWRAVFSEQPQRLSASEKRAWLAGMRDVVLGSDGYIPFRDSIDRAQQSGVGYVVQPGGSNRDAQVIQACNEYGMLMAFCGVRLFHH